MTKKSRRRVRDIESIIFSKKSSGASQRSIAKDLGISEWHVRTILRKSATHRVQAKVHGKVRLSTVKKSRANVTKAIILSDIHIPYHSQPALGIALRYAKDKSPDVIVLNGDIVDMYNVSRFPKDPHEIATFADELAETRDFLKRIRKDHPKAKVYYTMGNHECFDESTEILCSNGWKPFPELTENDVVGSFNIHKETIEFDKPLAIIKKWYEGEMYHIETRGRIDIMVTPNHRMLYGKGVNSQKHWSMAQIKDMSLTDGARISIPVSGVGEQTDLPGVSDDEIRIAGWLLTDGCVAPVGVTLYQRKSKAHLVTSILDRLCWDYSYNERDRDITQICGTLLKNKPETSCEMRLKKSASTRARSLVSSKKFLPDWCFSLSKRQFDILLSSMIDGDGSRHISAPNSSWMLYGTKRLLDDVQRACVTNGYKTSLATYRNKDYRLNICPGTIRQIDRIARNVSNPMYSGYVYCATTKNDTVVIRRNGKVSVTGNCRVEKYLYDRAPALSSLPELSIESLLNLEELDIELKDMSDKVILGNLECFHGDIVKKHSGDSARGHMLKRGGSILIGHVHKLGVVYVTDKWGTHVAIENGHLSTPDPDYMVDPNWQQGFTEIDVDNATGHIGVRQHHIHNNRLVADGIVYSV